jgi:hypothetical protein
MERRRGAALVREDGTVAANGRLGDEGTNLQIVGGFSTSDEDAPQVAMMFVAAKVDAFVRASFINASSRSGAVAEGSTRAAMRRGG